jgi:hypothetical protein
MEQADDTSRLYTRMPNNPEDSWVVRATSNATKSFSINTGRVMNANGYVDDEFQAERKSRRAFIAANQYRADLRDTQLERDILILGLRQLKKKYAGNAELQSDIDSIIKVSNTNISI